jgi:spore photoproduct lyase
MDISGQFNPQTILLWEKVAEHAEAQRIVKLFPSAEVRLIRQQRYHPSADTSAARALLDGKRTLMVGHASSFVGHSDGRLGSNVCCRPYYKLVPVSNGCPFHCTYCYLAFVYRKHAPFIKININYDTMFRQIRRAVAGPGGTAGFNMGEMLDSLALDHVTNLTTRLVPFFSEFSNAYLMLLTKSSNIANLLQLKPNRQTVVSWSLNTRQMIDTHEIGAASLGQRIQAAKICQDHGYRIRLRIDPGMLHKEWRAAYADLIRQVMTTIMPENITLGMLRLLPGHLRLAREAYGPRAQKLHASDLVKGASDGKLRYPPQKRIEFYTFLADTIRSYDENVSIGLCRETPDIWRNLKQLCNQRQCNCIIW